MRQAGFAALVLGIAGLATWLVFHPTVDVDEVATSTVLAIASALSLGLLYWAGLPSFQARAAVRKDVLQELAVMRTHGVEIRNEGLRRLSAAARQGWLAKAAKWETDVANKAGELSKTEGERLRTLDLVPLVKVAGVTDPEQLGLLRNLTETLKRLDVLLTTYLARSRE